MFRETLSSVVIYVLFLCQVVLYSVAEIPIIDVSSWRHPSAKDSERNQIVENVNKALEEVGFFAITGHGIDQELRWDALKVSEEFFLLPDEEKLRAKSPNATEYPYGYERQEVLQRGKYAEKEGNQKPDLKETWSMGPGKIPDMPLRRFPLQPASFSRVMTSYYEAMEELADAMLEIFACALDLPKDWFKEKMVNHISALRTLYYYGLDSRPETNIRASPHTDYGVMTLLFSGGPGLQAYVNNQWLDVPDIKDGFIVNIGDMMAMWTNDRWKSTLHRVVVNYDEDPSFRPLPPRQSMAFFVNVRGDCLVDPSDISSSSTIYKPVLARNYILEKHLASLGDHDEL